jgi:hypothetical protein
VVLLAACAGEALGAGDGDLVRTFTLTEHLGVSHPDQIVDFDLDKPVDGANCYLVGPGGQEEPYQLLEGGRKLAIRTHLPASRLAIDRMVGGPAPKGAAGLENHLFVADGVANGDAVRFLGKSLPGGLVAEKDYFVIDLQYVKGAGSYAALAQTPGGQAVPITGPGSNDKRMVVLAFTIDLQANRIGARAHGLHDGDPVRFATQGKLPAPLTPQTQYRVRNADADTFQLCADGAAPGEIITLTSQGEGLHRLDIAWTWTLRRGRGQKPYPQALKVAKNDAQGLWEITNGLLGVRIPVSGTPADPARAMAPVQGVMLADGTWTATGPNTLWLPAKTRVKSIAVNFVEQGPLEVVAQVAYDLDRAESRYGRDVVTPAGPGKYVSTIELQAGQPSALLEEDTDCQFSYNLEFPGITLNQARYRGHSVSDPRYGYRPDGQKVEGYSTDAFFDLPYDASYQSSYVTSFHDHLIRWMHPWDPWVFDSGAYWMLYDKDGPDAGPLIGFYDGQASRLRDAGAVGVGVHTRGGAGAAPQAGITVQAWQRGPDARMFQSPRWQWRLFVGRKGPDMCGWREIQAINRQMNIHSGINLNKISRLQFDFPAPAQGFGTMYMPAGAAKALIEHVRSDKAYYSFVYNAVSYYRDLIDMWRDDTGQRVHAMAGGIWAMAHDALERAVNQGGIIGDHGFSYWHGGLDASRSLLRADQVLASELATPADQQAVKEAIVFYGAVLWDDDHVPLSVPAGVNLGTANMPIQQQNYREMYALFLARHPMMKDRAAGVWERARAMIHDTINEHGAHMGSTHYIGAAMGPLLSTLQQLKQAGIADPFKEEERLKKYAEFEMNFATPPEPRFANRRVRPSIGDAEPGEATEFLGQLATAYADLDPALSARLMGAWRQSGKPHSDFHGATILKIDDRLPDADPKLGCAHMEGWYSVLRFGWGTPNETAAWFVNGNWYRDHASNDLGQTVIYALGAPLSLDFGSMYSPWTGGGFIHCLVLPEEAIGAPWKQNPPDVTKGPRWGQAKTEEYKAQDRAAWSRASFVMGNINWTRTLKVAMLRDDLPAIGIRDEFSGEGAKAAKVFMLNLMSDGPVDTPTGPKNVGDTLAIPAGVTRLHFTGQSFAKHPTGGIDWDLYVATDAPQEAFLAQWEHKNHGGERQAILRLHGTGRFQIVIVPYFKGKTPPEVTVKQQDGAVQVTQGDAKATF